MPFLMTLTAGGRLWVWLWGRWFSPGGEFLHGCLHLALIAGGLVFLLRPCPRRNSRADEAHFPSLLAASFFLLGAGLMYGRLPTLMTAGLYVSAVYWAFRSSVSGGRRGKPGPALWALLVLSLPITPSLQFVFGYPLRALAARTAALLLPGPVRAIGCGLSDGRVEVFVDAPCAGAGLLVSSLFLAAGAALVYRLGWLRTGLMLLLGTACAVYANAVRAALLYLGAAELIALPLHRHETAVGLFCFTASALMLLAAASFLARPGRGGGSPGPRKAPWRGLGPPPRLVATAACSLLGAAFFFLSLHAPAPASARPPEAIAWPVTWKTRPLIPGVPSPETEKFWSGFPGAYREFIIAGPETAAAAPERVVMRLVTQPTRLLHPAEDCFRGAGFSVTPLPAEKDESRRLWSGFTAKRDGRVYIVRQCVIAAAGFDLSKIEAAGGGRAWPDVSSWYWDVAGPGAEIPPLALAVTVIAAPH